MSILRNVQIALVALFLPLTAHAQSSAPATPVPLSTFTDYAVGSDTAPVEIIEYASFACPACKNWHDGVWSWLKPDYVDTGRVRFIIRPIVTQPYQIAAASAIMAECAGPDRYFETVDLLFAAQPQIFDAIRAQGDILGIYHGIGATVGVSAEDLQACLQDPAKNERIGETIALANADEVRGTPSFVINGQALGIDDSGSLTWGGEPLIVNGERLPANYGEDNFRRIVLHFLNVSDSDQ
ncbi:thioredoxin domain-containing protein [Maricaulis sp.]|uniref:DsbA family protein n=1 Tax=Maricaulis sp. TaxID=1486257 RepID=UPI00260CAF32|nr:thioredoxin domain-containing protein [Maricaulis sp.]